MMFHNLGVLNAFLTYDIVNIMMSLLGHNPIMNQCITQTKIFLFKCITEFYVIIKRIGNLILITFSSYKFPDFLY